MPEEACPLPTNPSHDEEQAIRRMLAAERIAIVGLSDDPSRASHAIGAYLLQQRRQIFPVNPNYPTVLGLRSYASLADIPSDIQIDLVNVFRRAEHCGQVARQAVERGAAGLWLQSGIHSESARKIARAAGIDYVDGRCIMVEHIRRSAL